MAKWEVGVTTQAVEVLFEASLTGNRQVLWTKIREVAPGQSASVLNGAVATAKRRMLRTFGVEFIPIARGPGNPGFRVMKNGEAAAATNHDVGRMHPIEYHRRKKNEHVNRKGCVSRVPNCA